MSVPFQQHRVVNRLMKLAVAAGAESAVRLHISRGDDLEWRDDRGFTPLMIAASRDRAAVCRLLIEAGVDCRATDASGRDALTIARDAGAQAATEAILAFSGIDQAESTVAGAGHDAEGKLPLPEDFHPGSGEAPPPQTEDVAAPFELQPPGGAIREAASETEDYGDWEQEDDSLPPTHDPTPACEQSAVQRAITDHVPIDDSADWDDFEAYLPKMAAPLARAEDAEFQDALRSLVLRASREGSVPSHAIEQLYSSGRGEDWRDREAERALLQILNDLGAEADERFEYASGLDDFRVGVGADETWDERDAIDEALSALSSMADRSKDPLRMQRRATQRIDLLTADEEVKLAKAMEAAVEAALDALANWPDGLAAIAEAIDQARAGRRLVSQIAASGQEEFEPLDTQTGQVDAPVQSALIDDDSIEEGADEGTASGSTDAMGQLERFRALALDGDACWRDPKVVRPALGAIAFRRSFLMELSDWAPADRSPPAIALRAAISDLRRHRDRMTVANLRLVFPLARKFLFSGLPLEDLSQEGNIGLLRAVDKFDWRRGLRFSTMATWWVRQAISRSIPDSAFAIRLPVHAYEIASRSKWDIEALEMLLGREPTLSELANRVGLPVAKIELLSRCKSDPLPLDSAEYERELERQDRQDAFAEAELQAVARTLAGAVASLGKKNAAVLRLRFGLGGVEPRTLEEVGAIFGVTRERARQIEAKAMRLLTSPARLPSLARALGQSDPTPKKRTDDAIEAGVGDEIQSATSIASSPVEPKIEATGFDVDVNVQREPTSDIRRLIKQAENLGFASLVSKSSGAETTWIFLDQPQDVESRALVRSMLRMGFTYHPGRGYSK